MRIVDRIRRPMTRRQTTAAAIAVGAVVLIAATALLGSRGSPGPSSSPDLPPSSADPTDAPQPWARLDLPPFVEIASLEPTTADRAGVAIDSAFTLTSLAGLDPAELAARLVTSPATEFVISRLDDPAAIVLRPTAPLAAGQLYRFALTAPDGTPEGSWAFTTRSALRIESTIPGDRTTGVPVDTGIEIRFDRPAAGAPASSGLSKPASMEPFFTIAPSVTGRLEDHGRTQVFVPDKLEPATLYTVTIRAGLPVEGADDLALPSDVVVRFETARAETSTVAPWYRFGRDVIESSPAEAPIMALQRVDPSGEQPPTGPQIVAVSVFRLPSLSAATTALRSYLDAPRWTDWSDPGMDTTGLPVAVRFDARLESLEGPDEWQESVLRFPDRLPEGWYIVEVAGERPAQAFLQVTAVSVWVTVAVDRTVVWVNDTSTGEPVEGATVAVVGGASLGTADGDGLLVARTPTDLIPPAELSKSDQVDPGPLLAIKAPGGRAVLVPFHLPTNGTAYRGEWWSDDRMVDRAYWSLLFTDRSLYRSDGEISAWGYLRARSDGRVPDAVELRLISSSALELDDPPVIARATATPGSTGAFAASVRLRDVPLGGYVLQASVDGHVAVSTWVDVGIIRKPTYELTVTPEHYAVVSGTAVPTLLEARFFDGQPAPAIELNVHQEADTSATTDREGQARVDLTVRADADAEDPTQWSVWVTPARAEPSSSEGASTFLVFPTRVHLDATGVVQGRRLEVAGSLHLVDFARLDVEIAAGRWDADPNGAPVAGRAVRAVVTELVPVRRQVGTDYDFIEKRTTPRYEWDIVRKPVGTFNVTTLTNGTFTLATTVPDGEHQYEVVLTAQDDDGRTQRRTTYAGKPFLDDSQDEIRFETTVGADITERSYAVGETVELTMTDGERALPTGGSNRYLYVVSQRGLRTAIVDDDPQFRARFDASYAPGVFVIGVRFTGQTYAPKAGRWATFDSSTRALTVDIASDRERYRPGETATFTISTADATGRPVAADVAIRAVDQKLFAIGGAAELDPLTTLYQGLDSGIVRIAATHQLPLGSGPEGEGGDTTGGGRDDFRDTLFFESVTTDAQGRASVSVTLSDDLTSWHLSATALTSDLQAGEGQLIIPVGLPLFVEATIADEYLAADQPTIRLRAFGDALSAGDPVEFSIIGPSLGFERAGIAGRAFLDVDVELPRLAVGRHALTITVTSPTRIDERGRPREDRLVRMFDVIASRLTATRTALSVLEPAGADQVLPPGGALTTYSFTDAGRGRWLPIIETLANERSGRLDRSLAQTLAADLLTGVFGRDQASMVQVTFDPLEYGFRFDPSDAEGAQTGLPLVPWGGPDLRLTALVAIAEPDRFDDGGELSGSLRWAYDHGRLGLAAVAGLAALGEPVTLDLEAAAARSDLTVEDRLFLGLGYAAIGDEAMARAIERDVLEASGERLGSWVRVRVSDDRAEIAELTALAALLAARIGDPLAGSLVDYLLDEPVAGSVVDLEVAAAIRAIVGRTPAAAAVFSYVVDGRRTTVALEPGETLTVSLTDAQRAAMRVRAVEGAVAIVASWSEPISTAELRPSSDLALERTLPALPIPTDHEVMITLTARLLPAAPRSGCYEVVETVPSGLAPLPGWFGNEPDGTWAAPSSVVGQTVTFCVGEDRRGGSLPPMRYLARIVTPGSYAWEPAVIQYAGAPELVAFTAPTRIEVRDP